MPVMGLHVGASHGRHVSSPDCLLNCLSYGGLLEYLLRYNAIITAAKRVLHLAVFCTFWSPNISLAGRLCCRASCLPASKCN